jgi:hypothetical protein
MSPDDPDKPRISWDWLPQYWTADPRMYDKDQWHENERFVCSSVLDEYCHVTGQFDELLARAVCTAVLCYDAGH